MRRLLSIYMSLINNKHINIISMEHGQYYNDFEQ